MVDENRIEGAVRKTIGKLEDTVGQFTGDTSTQAEGKARRAAGAVQGAYGETLDTARGLAYEISKITKDQPILSVLVAGSIGFILGRLSAGNISNRPRR